VAAVQKIKTFLWYDGRAEEAVAYYLEVFAGSVTKVARYGAGGPGPEGSVMTMAFELAGVQFVALNGGPGHPFTEAMSLAVDCDDQAEVDRYWDHLIRGGEPIACGWLKDRYGLRWQITPRRLIELISDPDPGRAKRAMAAMMTMVKIDIAALEDAVAAD
jgi:predicted 3-demethylubiquinone-9 3-methyltransferase (glyoxalase superfamily)